MITSVPISCLEAVADHEAETVPDVRKALEEVCESTPADIVRSVFEMWGDRSCFGEEEQQGDRNIKWTTYSQSLTSMRRRLA